MASSLMASSLILILRDPSTGQAITGKTLSLRVYPYNSDAYIATELSGKPGAYQFLNVNTGKYKLFVDGSEDSSFGGNNGRWLFDGDNGTIPIDILPSNIPADKIANGSVSNQEFQALNGINDNIQSQLDNKLDKSNGILTGNLNANSNKIVNLATPSNDNDATNLNYVNSNFLRKDGNLGTQNILSNVNFSYGEGASYFFRYYGPITHNNDITTRLFVENKIQEYLSGSLTAFQESPNIIRIIYSGTQETNRVYRTISGAMSAANQLASINREMWCIIHGSGIYDNLLINYNKYLSSDIHLYCHLSGAHPNLKVEVDEDQYIVGLSDSDLGKVILSNIIIWGPNDGHQTLFKRFVFQNCIFLFNNAGSLSLEKCYLLGTNVFLVNNGSLSMTNVKGNMYFTNIIPNESGTNPDYFYDTNSLLL